MNISIDQLFKNSFVITVNNEKYEFFKKVFTANNLPIPNRFDGIGFNGATDAYWGKQILSVTKLLRNTFGCSASHQAIVRIAKQMDMPFVCIFEDDAYPCIDIKNKFEYYLSEIPDDADCLILGNLQLNSNIKFNDKYLKLGKDSGSFWGSHAYIIFKNAYNRYINAAMNIDCIADHTFLFLGNTYSTFKNLFIQYNYLKSNTFDKGYIWRNHSLEQILKEFPKIEDLQLDKSIKENIEKNIFLIWFGQNLPSCALHSIDSYKQINPDFNINFIYEPKMQNAFDIENIQNQDLKDCINLIQSKNDNIYKQMFNRSEAQWIRKKSKTQINCDFALLSDAFRLYLLNKYGGIYVDVDTMPKKSFDDLLKYDEIQARTRRLDNSIYWDIYVIGFKKNYLNELTKLDHIEKIHELTDNVYAFDFLLEKYINEQVNSNEYFIHYFNNDWNKTIDDEKIDYVFPYCNFEDPVWNKQYMDYLNSIGQKFDDEARLRYIDNLEMIKYSLRSIDRYLPWINNVYLIVSGESQIPDWLDTGKVKIVMHDQILPKEMIPCFNSIGIEHYISRIPGLSEKFLYGNDDFLALKPLTKDMFFTDDGKLNIGIKKLRYDRSFYHDLIRNSWKLLFDKENKTVPDEFNNITYEHSNIHAFRPQLKSIRNQILNKYQVDIENTFSRIRKRNNLSMIEFPYYCMNGYATDNFKLPGNFHSYTTIDNDYAYRLFQNNIEKDVYYTMVINSCNDQYAGNVKKILDKKFDFKSKYEK